MSVDVHAHLLMPGIQAEVERRDPEGAATAAVLEATRNGAASLRTSASMIGERFEQLTALQARLDTMDAQGVERQWVSPSPNHYYPWADAELAEWVVCEVNRQIGQHVSGAPERLIGLGLVPLQHPELMVSCLDDAVVENGLAGVELSSFAGDVELSDERLEPFWARAEELQAVVFLHPFGCSLDARLDRFYLSNTVGQLTENAVALSHLIFAGVLDRHLGLKVIAAHGGGYLPSSIGRSDRAWHLRPEAQGCAEPPSSYLRRLWFDSVVHDSAALRHLISIVGADRVLMGSDYPFDMGCEDPVSAVLAADLGDDETRSVLSENAAELVPFSGALVDVETQEAST
ncbi:amidohydrolase family protein [Nesterenkonia sp. Act20]|uniref:amidohydrolase family protein n=1 Tax=Nesterenkonia sp. Act20 TaxID=1483432 RepID=UPI001C4509A5|nr:amidohydrolase family protein [Nesterenkonia sp. Act20]